MQRKCNIIIRRSKTPRLLTSNICMYMYIYVIYTAHIYLCMMPFLEVTILLNQHFIIVGNTVGKSATGILTLLI